MSVGIIPLRLPLEIEFAIGARVVAQSRNVKPVSCVAARIIVDEFAFKTKQHTDANPTRGHGWHTTLHFDGHGWT